MLRLPKDKKIPQTLARSRRQEKDLAKRIGGQTTIASGALDVKGDVRKKGILRIEAKTTSKASFSVTREMIQKIEDAALPAGEFPAIEIEFTDMFGKSLHKVAVVPVYVLELMGGWRGNL